MLKPNEKVLLCVVCDVVGTAELNKLVCGSVDLLFEFDCSLPKLKLGLAAPKTLLVAWCDAVLSVEVLLNAKPPTEDAFAGAKVLSICCWNANGFTLATFDDESVVTVCFGAPKANMFPAVAETVVLVVVLKTGSDLLEAADVPVVPKAPRIGNAFEEVTVVCEISANPFSEVLGTTAALFVEVKPPKVKPPDAAGFETSFGKVF